MTTKEALEATRYTIFRTGVPTKRHYQVVKLICGVETDTYWVQLNGRGKCYCNCPGFGRQNFPPMEHKHVKIALDYYERGEPEGALYFIEGTGAKTTIQYLGTKA
jgi:hypothetical protein